MTEGIQSNQPNHTMLTTLATILGVLFSAFLLIAVAGGLIALIYLLASTRVAEAEERQRKVLEFEARTKAVPND